MKSRLDQETVARGICSSRSQAENYIKLGLVQVNGKAVNKPGWNVSVSDRITIIGDQYVSRAALKLESIAGRFNLDFNDKVVLDVGSSTGGFSDFALKHGALKVIAVDVGTNQLHPSIRSNARVEVHEKTDIRNFNTNAKIDIVVADVSFISLKKVLPAISKMVSSDSVLIMMCKPQFEAEKEQINKGVVKNSSVRRQILRDFETWLSKNKFIIKDKADSQIAGTKGNIERFYKMKIT